MDFQPPPGGDAPSARSYIGRVESILQADGFDRTDMQALLEDAQAVQILDEGDLQDIFTCLDTLGRRLLAVGETDLGFSAFTAAADITLSAIGRGLPPDCAIGLANSLQGAGFGDASFQLLDDIRAAVEKSARGDLPLPLAQVDNAIGNQRRMVGDLDLAEEKLRLALDEFESGPGGTPALHSSILNNLGLMLLKKGAFREAGDHLLTALQIQEDIRAKPRRIAITLDILGSLELNLAHKNGALYLDGGYINQVVADHLRRAKEYLTHARIALQDALPEAAADYAICLGHHVDLARYLKDAESADRDSQEALEILEHTGAWDALWTARSNRAAVLYEQGKWASVVDLLIPFTEAPVDPTAATALTYLARAAARVGETSMSLQAATIVAEMDDQLVFGRIQSISEDEALHQFKPFSDRLEFLLGVGLAAAQEGAEADCLYEVALNRTGILAERFGSAWTKAYSAKGAPTDLVERVRSSRATAARMDLDAADAGSIQDARRRQREAARQAGLAEANLLRGVGQEAPMVPLIAPNDVRAALNADTLLLDFAFVRTIEDVRHYAVFIVRNAGLVELRDLGSVDEIDELIDSLEGPMRQRSADRDMFWGDAAKNAGSDATEDSYLGAAEQLAVALFPQDLDLPPTVRVSPIGLWSQVPFSLLSAHGRPLIENHLVSCVPSGRWLGSRALSSRTPDDRASPPMVMGDPDYDLDRLSEQTFPLQMQFGRLPNAAIEVRELAARLHVEAKTGKEANRTELANVRSPVVLHLATHGTMVDAFRSIAEQSEPRATVMKSVGGVVVTDEVNPSEDPFGMVVPGFSDDSPQARHDARVRWLNEIGPRDPRSRSLIVLAGANAWLAGLENPPEIGTGFLTAGEFALTDLTATELVVLSACKTGEGAVSVGDGTLLGLRSASLLAGAASCLTALWTVDDAATTELILAFYAALEGGVARDEALREAQLAVRATHPDPYYWAAWVLDGDNGPLHLQSWNPSETQEAHAPTPG